MLEPGRLDVNRVLAKLQQKLNEAYSTIVILEATIEQMQAELENHTHTEEGILTNTVEQPTA